jgi:hypothetical protein
MLHLVLIEIAKGKKPYGLIELHGAHKCKKKITYIMRVALRIFSCISCRRGFVMLRITRKKIYIMPHSAQMENLFSKI